MCSTQYKPGYKSRFTQQGYTIMELMIAVAIISIIAAIAIPTYRGYVDTTKHSTAAANASMLATAEHNYYYENDTFLAGDYVGGGIDTLTVALRWKPQGDKDQFSYNVAPGTTCATGITDCFIVTVTYLNDPTIVETVAGGL